MAEKPLNVLFITSDQQHWTAMGCVNPEVKTPNLDRLASEGTRFTRAYCPDPTCTPTRSSIITGQYPSRHGAWALGTKLPESAHTLGDVLHDQGYDTAIIGKAHFQPLQETAEFPSLESYPTLQDLDFWRNFQGPFYGFRHFELARNHTDEGHVGQHYAIWMEKKGLTDWREHFQKPGGARETPGKHKWSIAEEFHYNTWIAERTNARLDHCKEEDKPFFLWASFFDPHPSYLVPEPWDTLYDPDSLNIPQADSDEHQYTNPIVRETQKPDADFSWMKEPDGNACHGCHSHVHQREVLARNIAVYYGMTSCMDKYIGRILDHLEELGLADNTLVIFTSDHGHYIGQHGLIAKGPFHYEDGIRVPFIVRWPGKSAVGAESDAIQSLVDLPASILRACGIPVPRTMSDSIDQSNTWAGGEAARDHTSVEFHHQPTTLNLRSYVDRRYKLTVHWNRNYGDLFDLQDDPDELRNRWDDPDYAEIKNELIRKLLFDEMRKCNTWMPRVGGA